MQKSFQQKSISRVNDNHQKRLKGDVGEDIACRFLASRGYQIVARNYQKRWGELDIIAKKDGNTDFFEVKSVTAAHPERFFDPHRPEENVHGLKVRHIRRMVETFLSEAKISPDRGFSFHVICVFMDLGTRRASVKWIKDVIL